MSISFPKRTTTFYPSQPLTTPTETVRTTALAKPTEIALGDGVDDAKKKQIMDADPKRASNFTVTDAKKAVEDAIRSGDPDASALQEKQRTLADGVEKQSTVPFYSNFFRHLAGGDIYK